ncbi:MAG TPA: VWA domain-containing protein [Vicinamibacterales bacterium]|jgi:VWFA-related protein
MKRSRATYGVLLAFFLSGIVGSAQQPAQQPQAPVQTGATFRTTTRLIVQTVTVKDKDGKPIEGLTAKDFTITEDGMPQDIAFVEYQRLEAAPAQPPEPAAQAPAPIEARPATTAATVAPIVQIAAPPNGSIKYQDKRLLVMYFDGASMGPADGLRAYTNARKYIDSQMSPSDLIAIMAFQNGAVSVKCDFTSDKAKLREVIDILIYGDDANNDGIPDHPEGSAFGQNDAEFNLFNTDRQLAALQTAVQMLKPLPEQKTLLYFASGLRLSGADNMAQLRATENAAIRANVTLNPIDARGLVALPPLGDATRASPGGAAMFTGAAATQAMNRFQQSQDTLYSLAKDTGGKAMFDYNDLSLGIKQAADAVSSYYIIGYYSTHLANDGKFRRVKVALNGSLSASADVAYRQGYYGEKEFAKFNAADKDRQLEEAFMLDNPITEMTIALEVNFFKLNSAEYFVPVSVKIPGSELALAKRRGAVRTLLDFMGEVKDDSGYTIQNMRDKLDVPISADTAAQLAFSPIQYETGFTLLPGKYVLKLLARDSETGRIGTYQAAFTIPNLMKEEKRLPISSVVLSSQRVPMTEALLTVQKGAAQLTHPFVFDNQKLFPSVTRVFSKSKDMYVFLQAYQQKETTTQPMVAFVTFFHAGAKVLETEPLQIVDGIDVKSKAVPLRFSIPLEGLDVGRYDCQVTVLEPTGQKVAFWQAPIAVVP